MKDLLESWQLVYNSNQGGADIPVPYDSTLETLKERVLAIGGDHSLCRSKPTGAIHCYDVAINSWSVICEVPTPKGAALTAVLPNDTLLVVGRKKTLPPLLLK